MSLLERESIRKQALAAELTRERLVTTKPDDTIEQISVRRMLWMHEQLEPEYGRYPLN